MEIIKFDRVVSVNSEVKGHAAQNLLHSEISPSKSWMCEKGTEKGVVILQLEKAVIITSVHVGNARSAFIEILVGKAADNSDYFESLIPMSTFMNPHESKTGNNSNRTRFFNKGDFNESSAKKSWDRIKVVCSQPFNKYVTFGLCFLKVHGEKEGTNLGLNKLDEGRQKEEEEIQVGSFFKKRKNSGGKEKLSVIEQMKETEKNLTVGKHTPFTISKLTGKMNEKQSSAKKLMKSSEEERNEKKKAEIEKRLPKKEQSKKGEKGLKKNTEVEEEEKVKKKKRKIEESTSEGSEQKSCKLEKRTKEFGKLMEDVVLVISGFQNPLRGDIRSMALEMGAKYSADWDCCCTHLVCAYENTPKFRQVKGKGKIVRKEWVEKCYTSRKRYPWRRFALDKADIKKVESEEEIDSEEIKAEKRADENEYDLPTDEDEQKKENADTSDYPMPFLPNFFSLKTFYVDPQLKNKAFLERYIAAYDGILNETFDDSLDFYVTAKGGAPLLSCRNKAPRMLVVFPSWIWEVKSRQAFFPPGPDHLVL